jgi:UDP-glucose 4-epimerase
MKKRVLITGVAGMIGSHLLDELLARGFIVLGVDNLSFGNLSNIRHNLTNANFCFKKIDILNTRKIIGIQGKFDFIIHLAAFKKNADKRLWLKTLDINSNGTRNILELARIKKAKFIFASTSDVYGKSTELPFKEYQDSVIGPSDTCRWAYAVSKIFGEHLVHAYSALYGLKFVILRYFGTFSHRSNFRWSGGHIPIFIDSALKGRRIIIHGNGKQTRCMAHVQDIVDGTIRVMSSKKAEGRIINIGGNEELSVLDAALKISKLCGKDNPNIKFIPFKKVFVGYKEIMRRVPDLSRAKRLAGYSPKISFDDALLMAVNAVSGGRKNG